jgi:hypothetical protein
MLPDAPELRMRKEYDFSQSRKNPYAEQVKTRITIGIDSASALPEHGVYPGHFEALTTAGLENEKRDCQRETPQSPFSVFR